MAAARIISPDWYTDYPPKKTHTYPFLADKTKVATQCQRLLGTLLRDLLSEFETSPGASARMLRRLAQAAPDQFCAGAVSILASPEEICGAGLLAVLVVRMPDLIHWLTEPGRLSFEQAITLARRLRKVSPELSTGLAKVLPRSDRPAAPDTLSGPQALRALEILDVLQDPVSIPALRHLVRSTDRMLSSKAALALGRMIQNIDWAKDVIDECSDPRIRANVVEALWGKQSVEARNLFLKCSRASNNRLVGNATVGLRLMKAPEAFGLIKQLSESESVDTRKTATWVIGHLAEAALRPLLTTLMCDPDEEVRRLALAASSKLPASKAAEAPKPAEAAASDAPVAEVVPSKADVPPKDDIGFHLWVEGSRVGG